jgi:hypothetical protein
MTAGEDTFAQYDAAYVLGALTPADRHEYETHLATCADCTSAVRELAGMPGLLRQASAELAVGPVPDAGPVPDTLLPRLIRASRHERRRHGLWTAVAGGLAAAVIALFAVLAVVHQDSSAPVGTTVAMTAVRPVPIDASFQLQAVKWGTKVHLTCTYVGAAPGDGPYDKIVYRLVAVPRDGGPAQNVAQWSVVPGEDATVDGATDLSPDQIDHMALETTNGTVLLQGTPPAS